MAVGFYTSRVILNVLGVQDFGIYNVVGGVVAMIGLLKGAMTSATMRFITFELGRKDFEQLRKTYCISVMIYFLICVVFVLFAETIGLWFLNTQLTIPYDRMMAANWVYQCTIISIFLEMLCQPYHSVVIAHEMMSFYSIVSIVEVLLKLLFVSILAYISFDSLIVYGGLMMVVSLVISLSYHFFCKTKFSECNFKIYHDKELFKKMLSYSGWNLFGSAASLVKSQGLNILLNMFFNPVVNAARGISYQINAAVSQFSHNFYTAVRPQITKYYAQDDYENMFELVFRSSKMSFYLNLILGVPLLIGAYDFIYLWLGQVPDYTIEFSRLIILVSLIDAMAHPLMTSIHATGHVAFYQFVVGSMYILNLPVSYLFLKLGYPPITVFYISLIISILNLFIRLIILKHYITSFPLLKYISNVFGVCTLVSVLSFIIPAIVFYSFVNSVNSFIWVCIVSVSSVIITVYIVGLKNEERKFVNNILLKRLLHR